MIEANNEVAEESGIVVSCRLDDLLNLCRSNGYSMAVWRSPGNAIRGIIDKADTKTPEIDLENSSPGFYFHPFSSHDNRHARHFIRAQLRFTISSDEIRFEADDDIVDSIGKHSSHPAEEEITIQPVINSGARKDFIELVEAAKEAISQGSFQKIVPSRRIEIKLKGFDLDKVFHRLCERYGNAFVSATYIPETGLWIGASPEILVRTKQGRYFETVSLAGTQPYNSGASLMDVAWRQKEIEEQAYVSRYIINCFKKIRLREFDEIGPKTVIAGNLIHLKTVFRVDMQAVNFPQLGTVMLNLLHPTSAVCGMPLKPASEWLSMNEQHDREYFTGFLGPVNMQDATELYVNLRCMVVRDDRAWLYAGAGVTEDSIPEKEWEETAIKMNTILDIMN